MTDLSPEQIARRVEKQGVESASKMFEEAYLTSGNSGRWNLRTIEILDAPSGSDFMLGEGVDFYYRSFGSKTVVIVFLHTEEFKREINLILNSFSWPNET